ncbi:transposase [Lysinibacillus sp. NPDC095746]|uniref:transposase n=1 Tax=Lysinibacillus sp. NPDC095746 TaxID=3364134 RepID=UPI00382CA123
MSQKQYNKEFKQTLVELYNAGTLVNQLSSEYAVSDVTIYKWIKIHSPIEDAEELTAAEVSSIQKENLRLKQEIEILKKAMTSFHATLKKEEGYRTRYENYETARVALFKYIEGWYNCKRIHGAIGFLTPDEC